MTFKFSEDTIKGVYNKSKGRCWYCGKYLTIKSRKEPINSDTYVIDHFIPKKKGGNENWENLVPACWSCNNRKRSLSLNGFREIETRLKNNVPKFTDDQLLYLELNNIKLPRYTLHKFYFEIQGLE